MQMIKFILPILMWSFIANNTFADIRVEIKKSNITTNSSEFESQIGADEWIVDNELNNSWGEKSAYIIVQTDITKEVLGEKAKKDKDKADSITIDDKLLDGSAKLEDVINMLKIMRGL